MFVFCQDVPNCLFFDGSFTRNPNIWEFRSCTTCLVYGIISRIDFSHSSRLTEIGCKDKDFFKYLPNFSETFFSKAAEPIGITPPESKPQKKRKTLRLQPYIHSNIAAPLPKAGAKVEPFKHTTKYWRNFFFIKQKHYGQSAWKTNSYGENKKKDKEKDEGKEGENTHYIY